MDEYENLRTPPSHLEAEQSVLGGLMLDNRAFNKVSKILSEEDFYHEDHKFIYASIASLALDSKPFDCITLGEWLKSNGKLQGAQDQVYLMTLAKDTPSAANIEAYAEIVKDKAILRRLISTGVELQEDAYSNDGMSARDKLVKAQDLVIKLTQSFRKQASKFSRPKDVLMQIAGNWDKQQNSDEDVLLGLSFGIKELDEKTQGMEEGDLIIVGARPAMGKTAFQMLLESTNLNAGVPVACFSMEMPDRQLMERQISARSNVPLQKVKNSRLMNGNESEWVAVSKAMSELKTQPYYIDDTSAQSPQAIRDSLTAMNAQSMKDTGKPIGLVVLDYLQLMTEDKGSKAGNRTEVVSQFSGALKSLAKDFKIPVVALSQLNRSLENRPDKRPVMSDLRESGAIEQDADLILFLYREEVYDEDTDQKGVGEVIIGKQRSGPIGTVRAGFNGACTKWYDKSFDYEEAYR